MQQIALEPPRNRVWIKALLTFIIVAIALIGYFSMASKEAAPDVTFVGLNGEQIALGSLRGKVVIVNFWATSCSTCIKEMPQMIDIYNKYKGQGLEFVAVAMSYDPPNYVLNYAQTRKLPFKVALDVRGDLAKSFDDVKLTPTTFVIGKDGYIIKRYIGEPDYTALHQLLEKSLAV